MMLLTPWPKPGPTVPLSTLVRVHGSRLNHSLWKYSGVAFIDFELFFFFLVSREAPGSGVRVGRFHVCGWRSRVVELPELCGTLQP